MSDYARMAIASKNPDRYMLARVLAQLQSGLDKHGWQSESMLSDLVNSVGAQINAYFDKLDEWPEPEYDKDMAAHEIAKYVTRLETVAGQRDRARGILHLLLDGSMSTETAKGLHRMNERSLNEWVEKVNRGEA